MRRHDGLHAAVHAGAEAREAVEFLQVKVRGAAADGGVERPFHQILLRGAWVLRIDGRHVLRVNFDHVRVIDGTEGGPLHVRDTAVVQLRTGAVDRIADGGHVREHGHDFDGRIAHGEPLVLKLVAVSALAEHEDDVLADVERIHAVALQHLQREEGLALRIGRAVNELAAAADEMLQSDAEIALHHVEVADGQLLRLRFLRLVKAAELGDLRRVVGIVGDQPLIRALQAHCLKVRCLHLLHRIARRDGHLAKLLHQVLAGVLILLRGDEHPQHEEGWHAPEVARTRIVMRHDEHRPEGGDRQPRIGHVGHAAELAHEALGLGIAVLPQQGDGQHAVLQR